MVGAVHCRNRLVVLRFFVFICSFLLFIATIHCTCSTAGWLRLVFGLVQNHWAIGLFLCVGNEWIILRAFCSFIFNFFLCVTWRKSLCVQFHSGFFCSLTLPLFPLSAFLVEKLAQRNCLSDPVSTLTSTNLNYSHV